MIPVKCSGCGKTLELPDVAAGKKVRCKFCGNVIEVSAGGGASTQAQRAAVSAPAPAAPAEKRTARPSKREESRSADSGRRSSRQSRDEAPERGRDRSGRAGRGGEKPKSKAVLIGSIAGGAALLITIIIIVAVSGGSGNQPKNTTVANKPAGSGSGDSGSSSASSQQERQSGPTAKDKADIMNAMNAGDRLLKELKYNEAQKKYLEAKKIAEKANATELITEVMDRLADKDLANGLKGLVFHSGKWMPKAEVDKLLAEQERIKKEKEQQAKGLVLCDGEWVTPQKKAQIEMERYRKDQEAKGLAEYDGEWMPKAVVTVLETLKKQTKEYDTRYETFVIKYDEAVTSQSWDTALKLLGEMKEYMTKAEEELTALKKKVSSSFPPDANEQLEKSLSLIGKMVSWAGFTKYFANKEESRIERAKNQTDKHMVYVDKVSVPRETVEKKLEAARDKITDIEKHIADGDIYNKMSRRWETQTQCHSTFKSKYFNKKDRYVLYDNKITPWSAAFRGAYELPARSSVLKGDPQKYDGKLVTAYGEAVDGRNDSLVIGCRQGAGVIYVMLQGVDPKEFTIGNKYTIGGTFGGVDMVETRSGKETLFVLKNVELTFEKYYKFTKDTVHDEVLVDKLKSDLQEEVTKYEDALNTEIKPALLKPNWTSYQDSEKGFAFVAGKWQIADAGGGGGKNLKVNSFEKYASGVPVILVKLRRGRGSGSGFIIDAENGYIVTNKHVVEEAQSIELRMIKRKDGKVIKKETIPANKITVVAIHKVADLAVLKVDDGLLVGYPTLQLDKLENCKVGEEIFTIGNPGGFAVSKDGWIEPQVLEHTLTDGTINSLEREVLGSKCMQISAAINPGNSGGPVFGARGKVVGVATFGFNKLGVENQNFAVTVTHVHELLSNPAVNSFNDAQIREILDGARSKLQSTPIK